jgi:hypothetical protein
MAETEHQWDTLKIKKVEIEGISGAIYQDMPTVIDPMEAERFVESIRKLLWKMSATPTSWSNIEGRRSSIFKFIRML